MAKTREKVVLILWIIGFLLIYFTFFPIKGDKFSQYPPIYGYIFATLLLTWGAKFLLKTVTIKLAKNVSILIFTFAILFPILSFMINGKTFFIKNAAEYNYPTVLYFFLDTSNKQEIDLAIFYAKEGGNIQIVKDLTKKMNK